MITKEEVNKTARLAKLNLQDEELQKLTRDLGNIVQYIEKLNQLDLTHITATSHAVDVSNVFREDEVVPSQIGEQVLKRAPEAEDNFFKVPKII